MKQDEIEGVTYIQSKRGTVLVLHEGNSFTPNEKTLKGQTCRSWKCSMYYKLKCRARITTRKHGSKELLRPSLHDHNHPELFPKLKSNTL